MTRATYPGGPASTRAGRSATRARSWRRRPRPVALTVAVALVATGCTTTSGTRTPVPVPTHAATSPPATSPPATRPTPATGPPFIARVAWVSDTRGRILRVYPTPAGRIAALDGSAEAWSEVLRYAADAGSPGMQAQFECHWVFARIVDAGKTSWNLEPWRPVVTSLEMRRSRCNPGGAEETVPGP